MTYDELREVILAYRAKKVTRNELVAAIYLHQLTTYGIVAKGDRHE